MDKEVEDILSGDSDSEDEKVIARNIVTRVKSELSQPRAGRGMLCISIPPPSPFSFSPFEFFHAIFFFLAVIPIAPRHHSILHDIYYIPQCW